MRRTKALTGPARPRRGYWASWPQAGAPGGQLLANGLLAVVAIVQSDEACLSLGWRIPFLPSALLVLIRLYVRLSVEESPVFLAAQAKEPARHRLRGRGVPVSALRR